MRKVFLRKIVTILLIFSLSFVSLSPYLVVSAKEIVDLIDTVTLKDVNGNIIDATINLGNNVGLDEAVSIHFEWSTKNHNVLEGDTFTVQIPDTFKIYNEVNGQLYIASEGVSAGTFHVSKNGLLTIVFNDYVNNHPEVSGDLIISTHFNKEVIIENNVNAIIFNINNSMKKEIKVQFTPDNTSENITKTHSVSAYNPTEITWEVRVNKRLDLLKDVEIEDVFSAGQEFIPYSLEIYKLHVNLDGTDETTTEKYTNYTLDMLSDHSFLLGFNDEINDAYVIRYKTKITDLSQTKFTNTATLNVNGKIFPSVDDSVTIKRGALLHKNAMSYNQETKEVTWKVQVNFREANLGKIELNDLLSTGQTLVSDSIIVREVTINESGHATVGNQITSYILEETGQGFSLVFEDTTTAKAYEITYKTIVTDSSLSSVTNKIELISNGSTIQSSQSSISVAPAPVVPPTILEKRTTAKFNYETRLQNWAITVNSSEVTLAPNTTITDTFPDGGMQFVPDSLTIKDAGGNLLNKDEYSLERIQGDDSWEKGFIIRFHSEVTKKYIISYQTKTNPATHKPSGSIIQFKNVAVIETEINGESVTKQVVFNMNMNNRIVANGEKTGSYNHGDHSIAWNILMNEDRSYIEEPIVRDTIATGLEMQVDSVEVHTVNMAADGSYSKKEKVSKDFYEVVFKDHDLTVQFKRPISERYLISYKTKIKDITQTVYKNTATVNDGDQQLTELSTTVSVPVANQYASKTGQQNGENIDWQIYLNQSQSTINHAVLRDQPSLGQKLIVESIKIFEVDVNQSGELTPQSTPIDDSLYDVDISYDLETGAEIFTITFKNTIDKSYLVTYSTKIALTSSTEKATLTNSAQFSGEGIKEEHSTSTSEVIVYVTEGSGTGSVVFGSIEIEKQDSVTGTLLEGAEFTLFKNGTAIQKLKTNEDGKGVFHYLFVGEYKVVETAAPEGYVLGENVHTIIIDSQNKNYSLIVKNDPIKEETGGNTGDSEDEETPGSSGSDSGEDEETPGSSDGDGGEYEETPGSSGGDGGEDEETSEGSYGRGDEEAPESSNSDYNEENNTLNKLPQTGENNLKWMKIIGSSLLVIVEFLFTIESRQKVKN